MLVRDTLIYNDRYTVDQEYNRHTVDQEYVQVLEYTFQGQITNEIFRERGDNGLLITLVPKFYDNVFLFVDLTTFGTSVNLDLLPH